MYYHATDESALLGRMFGSYDKFEGSPLSKGILQPDLWKVEPVTKHDWEGLRERVKLGMRNSLLLSLMPTTTTSQILGNTEAFEPVTSNVYTRKVLAGDFPVVNTHLYKELSKRGLWTTSLVNNILNAVKGLPATPDIQNAVKTAESSKTSATTLSSAANAAAEEANLVADMAQPPENVIQLQPDENANNADALANVPEPALAAVNEGELGQGLIRHFAIHPSHIKETKNSYTLTGKGMKHAKMLYKYLPNHASKLVAFSLLNKARNKLHKLDKKARGGGIGQDIMTSLVEGLFR
jgi:hypothetical protein